MSLVLVGGQHIPIRLASQRLGKLTLQANNDDNSTFVNFSAHLFLNDDYKLKSENFFQTNVNNLRGHSKKLFKPQSNLDHHKYFSTQRLVEPWNKLSEEGCVPRPFHILDSDLDPDLESRSYLRILCHCKIGQNMTSKYITTSNVHYYEKMSYDIIGASSRARVCHL